MKYVVDAREMKLFEEAVIETMGMPSLALMERAALAVAEEIRAFAREQGLRAIQLSAQRWWESKATGAGLAQCGCSTLTVSSDLHPVPGVQKP